MQSRWGFYVGLALVTLVTLALEVISARLFSVISWYHLSFFAVSVAMLGMKAGAFCVSPSAGSATSRSCFRSWSTGASRRRRPDAAPAGRGA